MLGLSPKRKKDVQPVVIQPTIQEQLAAALAKVQELDQKIKEHDNKHLAFVRDHGVITDGENLNNPVINPQAPATMSDDHDPDKIMQEFHSYKLQRNHLQYEFSQALSVWSDLKMRCEQVN